MTGSDEIPLDATKADTEIAVNNLNYRGDDSVCTSVIQNTQQNSSGEDECGSGPFSSVTSRLVLDSTQYVLM